MTSRTVAAGVGCVFFLAPLFVRGQVAEQILRSFGVASYAGFNPQAPVILGADGALYGTTIGGGSNGAGTVFKLGTNGAGFTVLHSFSADGIDGAQPSAGVIQGRDGFLYGTTASGGSNSLGTAFRINTNGTGYAVLHVFSYSNSDGQAPYSALLQARDGILYGTTSGGGTNGAGTVFRMDTTGANYFQLHHFQGLSGGDGEQPKGALVEGRDGALYGTTYYGGNEDGGTVFALQTNGASYAVLHHFSFSGGDGTGPAAALVQAGDGALCGTTEVGGTDGFGTVFRLQTNGASYSVLHSFLSNIDGHGPIAPLIQGADRMLYGTTWSGGTNGLGTVFKLNTNGTAYVQLRSFNVTPNDGMRPAASVLQTGDGALFGTTANGGFTGSGTIFRLSTNGTSSALIYHFNPSGGDGSQPFSLLIQGSDGAFYGTTSSGGTNGQGTVFKMNADGTGFAVLHHFTNTPDGAAPKAGLLQGKDGVLYGTTTIGGFYSQGSVFKINPNGSGYSILHDFVSVGDGRTPETPLIQAQDGRLYGTTYTGNGSDGTIFRIETNGANYAQIYLFSSANLLGWRPRASLLQGKDGLLYGTTSLGGNSAGFGKGVVFRVNTNGLGYTVLHNFGATPDDGIEPHSALVQTSDGTLYGMSSGAVFKVQTNGTGFAALHSLSLESAAGVTLGADGKLYGMRMSVLGVVDGLFRLDTTGSNYTILNISNPAPENPSFPQAALFQASDGMFYGMTQQGGSMNLGTVFRLNLNLLPQILSPARSGGNFTFSLQTASGQSYTIQARTNLTVLNWAFYTNVTGNGGLMQFTIPVSSIPQRFFRVSVP